MTKATAYNTLGTKHSRVVANFDAADLDDAVRFATRWNSDETRKDMMVHFVSMGGTVRSVADVSLPLFGAA